MGLTGALPEKTVAVDTAIFIYFLEEHPAFAPAIRELFQAADRGEVALVTSGVTLLEVLVQPYRVGNLALAERYESLLTRSRGLTLVPLHPRLLRAAAQLRAVHGVRTPDALQLAAALMSGCGAFLTNDRRLPQVPGLRVVQLGEVVS